MAATRRPPMVWSGIHGLVTIAATSLVTNQAVKRFAPRERPPLHLVPPARRAPAKTSPSFPSGHTASAVGFVVVATRHDPRLGLPLATLATAVGLSRVFTGLHYPGDVLGGALLGATIGAGGRAILRRWNSRNCDAPNVGWFPGRSDIPARRSLVAAASR